jgi:dinuclear metal center YbgI/SA1388 family protein
VGTEELAAYLDEYLRIGEIGDGRYALNGLQVMNAGEVTSVAAAVDASQASIESAADAGADLLLVHHGLFWEGPAPLTGRRYRRIRRVFDAGMAVYSAHLPLDVHPEVGNAAVLARELGLRRTGEFGSWEGVTVGVSGELDTDRDELAAELGELLGGPILLLPGGSQRIKTVGVITGGGGSMIADAVAAGLDAYVTGEGAHHTYFDAMENGINVYYAGHYATETWGVRALAAHLEERFDLPWAFIDQPTGL